jgi:hypothetical protein
MDYETQMPPCEAHSRGGHHRQNPRSRFQNLQFQYKGHVTSNMHMKYKSPIIWPKLKFLKSESDLKVKVTRSNILVPVERSCHKEHTYEIPITYHSKDMTNVKKFSQTDR